MRTFAPPKLTQSPLAADLIVVAVVAAGLLVGVRFGLGAPEAVRGPEIQVEGWALPFYALCSLGRMALAYLLSLAFTIVIGSWAARSRPAGTVLLPVLDVLQSVPILSFLPVVLLGLTALLPEEIAVELAAVVLIFTSQVWNMTYSYYQSLRTVPREIEEASAMFGLGHWLRLTRVDLPFAAIGLVWNSVMSWAGGWFFLMAAETFTVGNRDFRLPGIGSYLQAAAEQGDTSAVVLGIAVLIALIVALDQLVWRPLLTWTERFKMSQVAAQDPETSWFLDAVRHSRLIARMLRPVRAFGHRVIDRLRRPTARPARRESRVPRRAWVDRALLTMLLVGAAWALIGSAGLLGSVGADQWMEVAQGAIATLLRVTAAVAIALVWTVPAGVLIGTNRRAAQVLRPLTQIAASVPATALFPVLLAWFLLLPAGENLAAVTLMLLGTQWYILFNVIAATSAIPQDLLHTAELLGLRGWRRWRSLILPAIFPFVITGLITASGGGVERLDRRRVHQLWWRGTPGHRLGGPDHPGHRER